MPFTYCFSPTLVPRPSDWPRDLIDIVGFFSLDGSKSNYKPSQELADFLAQKDKPVYFGFGSLVVEKPQVQYLMSFPSQGVVSRACMSPWQLQVMPPSVDITVSLWAKQELTRKILRALAQTGQRAIISKGWGKLGTLPDEPTPPNVLVIDSVPHDYLFPRCAAVVHHGLQLPLDALIRCQQQIAVFWSIFPLSSLLWFHLNAVKHWCRRSRHHGCWTCCWLPHHHHPLLWGPGGCFFYYKWGTENVVIRQSYTSCYISWPYLVWPPMSFAGAVLVFSPDTHISTKRFLPVFPGVLGRSNQASWRRSKAHPN